MLCNSSQQLWLLRTAPGSDSAEGGAFSIAEITAIWLNICNAWSLGYRALWTRKLARSRFQGHFIKHAVTIACQGECSALAGSRSWKTALDPRR